MTLKVAFYARYSSDLQNKKSVEDQVRMLRTHAEREGWNIVEIYSDEAMSGATMMRPGLQRMMLGAATRKFDAVISEALDRLSRDQEDIAGIYKRLQFAGVKILTLSEGEINSLHIGLKGTMNAMYLQDLAQKTRRGLGSRIEKGKSGGGISYGYDIVKMFANNGEPIRGERTINQVQADVVRRIFKEYLKNKSPRAIAFQLNKEKVPCPSGGEWGASTIYGNRQRGTGILNNEMYIGKLVWNKLRYIKDPDTGKKVSRFNPEQDWITCEVPELRIVDQETWDKVKQKQGRIIAKDAELWNRRRPKHLFSFQIKCGVCGGGFSKISKNHYGCSTARNKGTCSNFLTKRQDEIQNKVLTCLQDHFMDEALLKEFCQEFVKYSNQLKSQKTTERKKHHAEIERLEQEKAAIIKAIKGGFDAKVMKDEFDQATFRITELKNLLETVEEENIIILPNMAEIYREKVKELISSLNNLEIKSQASDLLRSLISRIVLTPNATKDKLNMDIEGDLAGILTIASNSIKPLNNNDKTVQQVTMVAGAFNRLYLLWNATG